MKTAFRNIEELLEDPFLEVALIGKEGLKTVTVAYDKLGLIPPNFRVAEWAENDQHLPIYYAYAATDIGRIFIAATGKGLCYLGFENLDSQFCVKDLERRFPKHELIKGANPHFESAIAFCNGNFNVIIMLHLKGTAFQLDIWKKLLQIPQGTLTTYASLHMDVKVARAVGSAVGENPISYIIPCHRVVRRDGSFHGYFWGTEMKRRLLAYELQSD